ncbi:MAG: nicotinate-nucleotide adenylyltransferase [Kiritimatiellae bacterium]|nr:nicotinate-nucleotide adenylyltransferase [Kiritimatiellia bacterium]
MRIGILGGSFNPIHRAHLEMGRSAAEAFGLERVLMMPAFLSPFKTDPGFVYASAEDRAEMVKLAISGDPLFSYCGIELERGGVSFTVDSVRTLKTQFPDTTLFFIVGMDSLLGVHLWKESAELLRLCEFITLARPGVTLPTWQELGFPEAVAKRLLANVIRGKFLDVSSSEIRSRIAQGLPIDSLVPPVVSRYIEVHGLYRGLSSEFGA